MLIDGWVNRGKGRNQRATADPQIRCPLDKDKKPQPTKAVKFMYRGEIATADYESADTLGGRGINRKTTQRSGKWR